MPNTFVISDTWFNRLREDDPNINVVDSNEHIVQCWNDTVNKFDKVYVLGGFGIGDLYHILVKLNGEIHFLDNFFNEDEKTSISEMRKCIKKSSDLELKNRIYFDNDQIIVLNKLDSILSYFPLEDWSGKSTGTYCFHGLTMKSNLNEHNISCVSELWEYEPVNIKNIQENISTFKSMI